MDIGRRTIFEAVRFDYILSLIDDIGHVDLQMCERRVGMHERQLRTPTTCFAPALAANMLRMPVPHPTSKTVFPLKRWLLSMIAVRYDPVLTESLSISS
jgi:hypothetical protein